MLQVRHISHKSLRYVVKCGLIDKLVRSSHHSKTIQAFTVVSATLYCLYKFQAQKINNLALIRCRYKLYRSTENLSIDSHYELSITQ